MIGETSRSVALGIFLLFGNFASGFSPQKWQHPPKSSNKSVPSPPTSGVLKITPSPFFGSPFLPSPPPNPNKNTPPWNWWNLPQTVSPIFPHEKKNTEKPKNQLLTVALNKAPSWKVGGRLVPGEGSLSPNAPQGPTCSPQLFDKIGLGIY